MESLEVSNCVGTRKRKCKRTQLLMEYLSKKKKANVQKVKLENNEDGRGIDFQKYFELSSNNHNQLAMKPKAQVKGGKRKRHSLGLNQSRRKDVKYVNALKHENLRRFISLFSEDKESQENRKRQQVKRLKSNGKMVKLKSALNYEVPNKETSKYILNEITGNLHPASEIEKAMSCKYKQIQKVDVGIQATTVNYTVTPKNSEASTLENVEVTHFSQDDTH